MLLAMTAPDSLRSVDHTRPYRDSMMSYSSGSSGLLHSISLAEMPTSQRQRNMGADWAPAGNTHVMRSRSFSVTANNAPFRRPSKTQSVMSLGESNPASRSNSFNTPLAMRGSMAQLKSEITPISEVPDFSDIGTLDLGLDDLFKVLACGPAQAGGLPPAAEMMGSRDVKYSSGNAQMVDSAAGDFSRGTFGATPSLAQDTVPQQPSFATTPRPFTSYSSIELIPAGVHGSATGHHSQASAHHHQQQQHQALQYTMDVTAFAAGSANSQQFSPESFTAEPWEMDTAAATLQMGTAFSPFIATQQQQPPAMGGMRSVPNMMMGSSFFMSRQDLSMPVADTLAGSSQPTAHLTGAETFHQTPGSRTVSPVEDFSHAGSGITSVPRYGSSAAVSSRMSMDQCGTGSNSMAALNIQRRQSEQTVGNAHFTTQQQQQQPQNPTAALGPRTPSPGVLRRRANTYSAGHVSPPAVSQLTHASSPPSATHTVHHTPAHTPGPRMLLPAQPLPTVKEMDNTWRRKRQRRSASQLMRNHTCPVIGCEKRYEAWRSLQHHLSLKHDLKCKQMDGSIIAMNADAATLDQLTQGAIVPAPSDPAALLQLQRQQRKMSSAANPLGQSLDDLFLFESADSESAPFLSAMSSVGALPLTSSADSSPAGTPQSSDAALCGINALLT